MICSKKIKVLSYMIPLNRGLDNLFRFDAVDIGSPIPAWFSLNLIPGAVMVAINFNRLPVQPSLHYCNLFFCVHFKYPKRLKCWMINTVYSTTLNTSSACHHLRSASVFLFFIPGSPRSRSTKEVHLLWQG